MDECNPAPLTRTALGGYTIVLLATEGGQMQQPRKQEKTPENLDRIDIQRESETEHT